MIKRERRSSGDEPYFSICIPQYNRTDFLIAALRTIDQQDFRSFEICISDDVSTDGRHEEIIKYLEASGMTFCYVRQATNLRYDANLRAAISFACGRYCFLLGNDDGLSDTGVLRRLANELTKHGEPGVALTNYRSAVGHTPFIRVQRTEVVGSGAVVAVNNFRHFSFVSGVLIRRDLAHRYTSTAVDGSEMYQVYLVARAMAEGEKLLTIRDIVIDKDLAIAGQTVDSYAAKPRLNPCPIEPRKLNLVHFPSVLKTAIGDSEKYNERVLMQLYTYTYPYWLLEYRRIQSWKYALGIALGQRPKTMMKGLKLSPAGAAKIRARYALVTLAGLLVPAEFTQNFLAPIMYRLAKRRKA